jgi:hypothetical protein
MKKQVTRKAKKEVTVKAKAVKAPSKKISLTLKQAESINALLSKLGKPSKVLASKINAFNA